MTKIPIEMSAGLARQRRNLLIISILIIVFAEGGVVIEDFSLIGLKLKFKDFRIVYISLWVLFSYFLIRYYQYCREEPDLGIVKGFWDKLNSRCWEKIRQKSIEVCPPCEKYGGKFMFSDTKKSSFTKLRVNIVSERNTYGEAINKDIEISMIPFVYDIVISFFHVLINRKGVSDYLLPYLIATMASLYAFSLLWEGSIVNIIKAG